MTRGRGRTSHGEPVSGTEGDEEWWPLPGPATWGMRWASAGSLKSRGGRLRAHLSTEPSGPRSPELLLLGPPRPGQWHSACTGLPVAPTQVPATSRVCPDSSKLPLWARWPCPRHVTGRTLRSANQTVTEPRPRAAKPGPVRLPGPCPRCFLPPRNRSRPQVPASRGLPVCMPRPAPHGQPQAGGPRPHRSRQTWPEPDSSVFVEQMVVFSGMASHFHQSCRSKRGPWSLASPTGNHSLLKHRALDPSI